MTAAARPEFAIIHNHWIHYKDLLFRALLGVAPSFIVVFTAARSRHRLGNSLPGAPYDYLVSFPREYEEVSQYAAAVATWRTLSRLRPRVLVISGWYDGAAWGGWLWALAHSVPIVLWAESNSFDRRRRWLPELIKRVFVARCAAAHVYGKSNSDYLRQLGMPEARILTKRAVLDVSHFVRVATAVKDSASINLLYVGRFSAEKNLHRLLEALALAAKAGGRPLKLTMVGYGPLEPELRERASALGVADMVTFQGPADQRELPAVYSRAHVLILPSLSETWGLVANEAMCCELPVALSQRCGCAADLVSSDTGWLFDPCDVNTIANVLRTIQSCSDEQLAEMGQKARRVASTYSPEACAARVAGSIRAVAVRKAC
jgi:glycosyltransferase involved in cell wall biosynthesis